MRDITIIVAISLLIASTPTLGVTPLPDPADPLLQEDPAQRPPPGLADRDRNRISDDLQARLAEAGPQEPLDVVVSFSGPGNAASAQRAVGPFQVRREFTIIDGFAATMTTAQIRGLARTRGVFRVEEDFEVMTQIDEARASFGVSEVVSVLGYDGAGVTACVIDTGSDPTHEQLDSKFASDPCWADFVDNRSDPYDDHGHGTHVASILLGDGDGGADASKYRGVAPQAGLCAAKVLNSVGSGTESAIISGIEWCAERADIISMSLGTSTASDGQDALSQAVNNAAGDPYYAIPVVAAGNSGDAQSTIGSPGAAERAITVGAVYKWRFDGDALAAFSSRGPILDGRGDILYDKPDVAAPGVDITAAQANSSGGQGYVAHSGTSMATPFVSGAVALALQADPALADPTTDPLPVDRIRERLDLSSVDRGPVDEAPEFKDPDWGHGEIDVRALLAEDDFTPFPTYRRLADTIHKNGEESYSFELTADDLDTPVGVNIDIEGEAVCRIFYGFFIVCGWDPDLDAELYDPDGTLIASSGCPGLGECSGYGRWETLRADPTKAGSYTVRVYAVQDDFNNGNGGDFTLYFASAPLEGGDSSPPPENSPPVANDDSYATDQGTQLIVAAPGVLDNDFDADGDALQAIHQDGPLGGQLTLNSDGGFTYTPDDGFFGDDSFTYVASDGSSSSDAATVTVTVNEAPAEPSGMHVGDLDGSSTNEGRTWTAHVTISVHDGGHGPVSGTTVSGEWSSGEAGACATDNGTCTVSLSGIRKRNGSVAFTVTGIDDPSYAPSDNHDPDGDSDGTAIAVSKP